MLQVFLLPCYKCCCCHVISVGVALLCAAGRWCNPTVALLQVLVPTVAVLQVLVLPCYKCWCWRVTSGSVGVLLPCYKCWCYYVTSVGVGVLQVLVLACCCRVTSVGVAVLLSCYKCWCCRAVVVLQVLVLPCCVQLADGRYRLQIIVEQMQIRDCSVKLSLFNGYGATGNYLVSFTLHPCRSTWNNQ